MVKQQVLFNLVVQKMWFGQKTPLGIKTVCTEGNLEVYTYISRDASFGT